MQDNAQNKKPFRFGEKLRQVRERKGLTLKVVAQQAGVTVNGEKPTDVNATVSADELKAGVVIKKGKKVFHKVVVE